VDAEKKRIIYLKSDTQLTKKVPVRGRGEGKDVKGGDQFHNVLI